MLLLLPLLCLVPHDVSPFREKYAMTSNLQSGHLIAQSTKV
jgi:hypothetical protein